MIEKSSVDARTAQEIDMTLRKHVMSLCAPLWWESDRQIVVNSGTMCVVQTPEILLGITNNHVLEIYERHKIEKPNIFCQLGSAPFEPSENLIDRSRHWDLATFSIPNLTRQHWGGVIYVPPTWPPPTIQLDDHVVSGGYPEARRSVPPGPNPPSMSIDFLSFRRKPNGCSGEQVSFHIDPSEVTWLPNVQDPLLPGTSLSGMSGGPCFRLIAAENRIELGAFIYEGDYTLGIIFARQAALISANGQIAPIPL